MSTPPPLAPPCIPLGRALRAAHRQAAGTARRVSRAARSGPDAFGLISEAGTSGVNPQGEDRGQTSLLMDCLVCPHPSSWAVICHREAFGRQEHNIFTRELTPGSTRCQVDGTHLYMICVCAGKLIGYSIWYFLRLAVFYAPEQMKLSLSPFRSVKMLHHFHLDVHDFHCFRFDVSREPKAPRDTRTDPAQL